VQTPQDERTRPAEARTCARQAAERSGCVAHGAPRAPLPAAAQTLHATLESYQQIPACSSSGTRSFRARIDEQAEAIHRELSCGDLEGGVQPAHKRIASAATGLTANVDLFALRVMRKLKYFHV
jgi:hypothetical protein